MRAAIDVTDRHEADRIKAALEDETMRAVVNIVGLLLPLSHRARRRVLAFAIDKLAEVNGESLLGSSALDLPDAVNKGRA
jgi:hypothetical protein